MKTENLPNDLADAAGRLAARLAFNCARDLAEVPFAPGGEPAGLVWLAHGECLPEHATAWRGYAWVEVADDTAFDPMAMRFHSGAAYAAYRERARPWFLYAPDAAALIAAAINGGERAVALWRYENWHVDLRLPRPGLTDPTRIDLDRAVELIHSSGIRPDLLAVHRKRTARPMDDAAVFERVCRSHLRRYGRLKAPTLADSSIRRGGDGLVTVELRNADGPMGRYRYDPATDRCSRR
jgi:hypothetical protein